MRNSPHKEVMREAAVAGRRKLRDLPEIEKDALRCPFCGSLAEIEHWHGGGQQKRMISCSDRDCAVRPSVTGSTRKRALAHWNTRAIHVDPRR